MGMTNGKPPTKDSVNKTKNIVNYTDYDLTNPKDKDPTKDFQTKGTKRVKTSVTNNDDGDRL